MLVVEEKRSLAEMEEISDEWRLLHSSLDKPSLFLGYDWFRICAKQLEKDQRLLILTVRQGGRLIGIAPLIEKRVRVRHFPVREIGFLMNPVAPFVDFILLDAEPALTAVLQYLLKIHSRWDVLSFVKLRDYGRVTLLTKLVEPTNCLISVGEVCRTPFLPLASTWEEFYKSKSRKFRMTRRSVANRLQRLGSVSVERVRAKSYALKALEDMLVVSRKGWKRIEGRDPLSVEFERSFFSALTAVAARQGWLNLWLLRLGEDVIAAEYHLNDQGTMYGLRPQYDEAYAAYSPGRYLDYEIVEQLFRDGCTCYDMGPGAADYKLAWTDLAYACYGFQMHQGSSYSKFIYRLEHEYIPAAKGSKLGRWLSKFKEHGAQKRTP